MNGKIVVTGASGWVGRTILEMLSETLSSDEFEARVCGFSSKERRVDLLNGKELLLKPLTDLPMMARTKPLAWILHCAFLTPDHYKQLGAETYSSLNREISSIVRKSILSSNAPPRVVTFSSGAATLVEQESARKSAAGVKLYGQLKLEEEASLKMICQTLVLRIFALTGRYIRNPKRYALGEFLYHIHNNMSPQIRSQQPVVRGYGHADAIAALALQWLASEDEPTPRPIPTISHTVELTELAAIICHLYRKPAPITMPYTTSEADSYTDSEKAFLNMLERYGLVSASLQQQVLDTARAFK
ncbi:MAG: hypothetical protein ACK4ZO_14295 [Cyanobacteriota bacterium]|jgi:nucleoside-diphosphate-sugar epimerase